CIPLEEESQKIFAFEWESPTTGRKTQLCWTVLLQGFKNSPTLFGNALAKELEEWQGKNPSTTLLQYYIYILYILYILLGAKTEQECKIATIDLLNFLGLAEYRVSQKKAQVVQTTVIYLGFEIAQGKRELGMERKEAICRIA
ncbi:hypothetical protein FQV24_0015616, partial [Spheniscus mendiculus]